MNEENKNESNIEDEEIKNYQNILLETNSILKEDKLQKIQINNKIYLINKDSKTKIFIEINEDDNIIKTKGIMNNNYSGLYLKIKQGLPIHIYITEENTKSFSTIVELYYEIILYFSKKRIINYEIWPVYEELVNNDLVKRIYIKFYETIIKKNDNVIPTLNNEFIKPSEGIICYNQEYKFFLKGKK
jgi:hypothetical protein